MAGVLRGRMARVLAGILVLAVWVGVSQAGAAAAAEDTTPFGAEGVDGTVALALEPARMCGGVGTTFVLTLNSHAGSQAWVTMDADIRFPAGVLQVVDAGGNPAAQIEALAPVNYLMKNTVDNNTGRILYGAGVPAGGAPVSGDVALATIRFKALGAVALAAADIVDATVAAENGAWLTGPYTDASFLLAPTAAPHVEIRREGNDAALEWGAAPGAVSYQVWRKTAPHVTPGGAPDFTTTASEWPDPGAMLVVDSRYYTVRTDAGCQASGYSNETGKFSFRLTPGS